MRMGVDESCGVEDGSGDEVEQATHERIIGTLRQSLSASSPTGHRRSG